MCFQIYLASDSLLPEINPYKPEQDEVLDEIDKLMFSVEYLGELPTADEVLQSLLTKNHLYWVASHGLYRCGCFFCGNYPPTYESDIADNHERQQILAQFREYLEQAVESGPVEVYIEDVRDPVIENVELIRSGVSPDHFSGESFEFKSRELIIVE